MREIEVTLTFKATVAGAEHTEDYGPYELADVISYTLGLGRLDSTDVDISAFEITSAATAVRAIQPGDLVERVGNLGLDDREVVSVGRDFLTLDVLGTETARLPKDNYRTTVPAEGSM